MTSAVEPAWCQTTGRARFVAATGGQCVVFVVDEHGFDVAGADAGGLQGQDLAVIIAVGQEAESGAFEVADPVEGLAHDRARWDGGWWRAPG
ncbi:MAG: hypothetical protein GEU83_09285 [Pseudonocardiaceae bacterium]|nr:hypothetical protein [Pseudonocardiaceae bacterium]